MVLPVKFADGWPRVGFVIPELFFFLFRIGGAKRLSRRLGLRLGIAFLEKILPLFEVGERGVRVQAFGGSTARLLAEDGPKAVPGARQKEMS